MATLILWACVFVPTIRMVPSGRIFDAPCLEEVIIGETARAVEKSESPDGSVQT